MSKALVVIKSMGIGDLVILIPNIHALSKSMAKSVVVLAQKNTHAAEILKCDPHVEEVIELDKKGFFNIIKKIKPKKFDKSYIYSDSVRLYLIFNTPSFSRPRCRNSTNDIFCFKRNVKFFTRFHHLIFFPKNFRFVIYFSI